MMLLHFTLEFTPGYGTLVELINQLHKLQPADRKRFMTKNQDENKIKNLGCYFKNLPVGVYSFPESFESSVTLHCSCHVSIVCIHKHITLQGHDIIHSS